MNNENAYHILKVRKEETQSRMLNLIKFRSIKEYYFFFQNTKNKTAVKLTAVSCAPVVEVKIKRPDTKYQLGFSVQNGVVSPHL